MDAGSPPLRPFADALRGGALVVDGAMGTQLYERGVLYSACFEELNLSRPELVSRVHEDYLHAGATCLETNTFGANSLRLEKHGLSHRVTEINAAAVKLARKAAGGRAYLLGCIGPSGYFLGEASPADLKKVRGALYEQARALVASGVDALVVETMRQTNELEIAVEAALAAVAEQGASVPVIGSSSLDELGRMADGTTAREIGERLKGWGVQVLGVNCSDGPMNVLTAAEEMLPVGLPLFCVPNAGLPAPGGRAPRVRVDAGVLRGVRAPDVQARGRPGRRLLRHDARARQAHRRGREDGRCHRRRCGRRDRCRRRDRRRAHLRRDLRRPLVRLGADARRRARLRARAAGRQEPACPQDRREALRRERRGEPAGGHGSDQGGDRGEDAEGRRHRRGQHRRRRARPGAHEQPGHGGPLRARGRDGDHPPRLRPRPEPAGHAGAPARRARHRAAQPGHHHR